MRRGSVGRAWPRWSGKTRGEGKNDGLGFVTTCLKKCIFLCCQCESPGQMGFEALCASCCECKGLDCALISPSCLYLWPSPCISLYALIFSLLFLWILSLLGLPGMWWGKNFECKLNVNVCHYTFTYIFMYMCVCLCVCFSSVFFLLRCCLNLSILLSLTGHFSNFSQYPSL